MLYGTVISIGLVHSVVHTYSRYDDDYLQYQLLLILLLSTTTTTTTTIIIIIINNMTMALGFTMTTTIVIKIMF
jgi:hypothetical protein